VITALHALLYSEDPDATRAFLRDVLGWPFLESDPGWLIFRSGPSELGVHPNSWTYEGQTTTVPLHHDVSLMCDDLEATIAELKSRGAEFAGETSDEGWGICINLRVPGAGEMLLFEPKYEPSHSLLPKT
jgi:catechol 2,3-dioxygenase-like lactoylglutathione lyase family enzyme